MKDAQQILTWAVLLSRWTDFARSAVALPKVGESGKIRRAVPAIIGLQAVTYALAEVPILPAQEQGVARDRAQVLINKYAAELAGIWEAQPIPAPVAESLDDARASLCVLEASLQHWA